MSLFKPRKFGTGDSASASRRSFLADSTTETPNFTALENFSTYSGLELTKNDKYCVSRLPALPPVLAENVMDDSGEVLNGYADNSTKCSLVISERAINVWPYRSTDETPISYEFPLDENQEILPLALLTLPSGADTLDPGLVIINSTSGLVRFYESVQHAPALGLINSKLIEIAVNIQSKLGEYITLAENVEPTGIVVATSWKRVVLVLLRDFKGAPRLSTIELVSPSRSSRLISGLFGIKTTNEIGDEIVSIKPGKVSNHGMSQEIIVQDARGVFKKFLFQSSASGAPYINHKKTLQFSLASYLENSIDGVIPGAIVNVKFIDLWPLRSEHEADNLYTALIRVQNSIRGVDEKRLLLITLQINESGVLLYGSHQLPDVDEKLTDSLASKPRLFIPKPGATAFVVVGNSVILTDMNTAFLNKSSEPSFLYYKPKWEDVVNFKTAVQIIGLGYEDKTGATSNPSLILVTKGYGVLRIERFQEDSDDLGEEEESTDPVYLLKSHIQQAIYYHESPAVDFDVGAGFPVDVVSQATRSIVSEILDSSSPYLASFFPSTRDSFIVRATSLRELIAFVKRNFESSWFVVLPEIVQALEKIEVSQSLWTIVDSDSPEAALLKEKLTYTIQKHGIVTERTSDPARAFFTHHVNQINVVLTDLVESLFRSDYSLPTIIKLLVSTMHDAVFRNETAYIFGVDAISAQKLWVFDTKLLILTEEIFSKAFCTPNKDFEFLSSSHSRKELIKLTETLYYLVTCAIQYMQSTDDDQLPGYLEWYSLRKGEWVNALMKHGAVDDALRITEKYQDFLSVAAVLEKERERTSPEYTDEKISYFLDKYGDAFASKMFDFYLKNDKIQRLLLESKDYQNYLEQYFRSNPRKTSQVAWIHYLLVKNYKDASNVLISLSSKKETDNQENRELNYSLAKLTAIAAKLESPSDSLVLDEIAVEAENSLVVIRIQNKLHQTISLFLQGKKELVTLDYFLENFVNSNLSRAAVTEELLPFFERFVNQMPLLKEQLISLLTLMSPTAPFSGVFADALTVAALIRNDSTFKQQSTAIWLRLLALTDDWNKITATSENTDEVNKMRVKETALYSTLVRIHTNKEIVAILDAVVQRAREGGSPDDENSDLASKLHQLVVSHNLALWIDNIKAEARYM